MNDLTENEFKEMQRQHYRVWQDMCLFPIDQCERILRKDFPKMYKEDDTLREHWLDF